MSSQSLPLDTRKLLAILQPNGILSSCLKGFEPRQQQQQMLGNIIDAYNHNQIALIEAGTGTGKSLAYLIPAIIWALKTKERTLISTNTINLQEQLLEKDIPLLLSALKLDLKVSLVKGMSNYLCLRKLKEARHELPFFSPEEADEVLKIDAWQQEMGKGSRSDLPFKPSAATWERVSAETDSCTNRRCPYYQECFFFKARQSAQEAQILIANHHLFFADLAHRAEMNNYQATAILPFYSRIILDEAHNIEDIATDYFATRLHRLKLARILARLASDRHEDTQGKLSALKARLVEHYGKRQELTQPSIASILQRLSLTLIAEKKELSQYIADTFHAFYEFVNVTTATTSENATTDNKLRLLPQHRQAPLWQQEVLPRVQQLIAALQRYAASLMALENDVQALKDDKLNEMSYTVRFEIISLANRLSENANNLAGFISEEEKPLQVRWIETEQWKNFPNVHLMNANLDISTLLAKFLFVKFSTIVLCSATLTTNKKFDFVKSRLGLLPSLLGERTIGEYSYDSPFDYSQQALLAIPKEIPNPDSPHFINSACEQILQTVQISHGNAFVLFTSYQMLELCHRQLAARLTALRFHLLKQGDDNRATLLKKFKETDRSILFGTDSFWEGVDVAGEALRCVIIVKLPFKVPSDPLFQARSEIITAQGGNPFLEYFVPNAIVKFKQGFGRLIRNKKDRGCIVCLDQRLITKSYGKLFLNSLPNCQCLFDSPQALQQAMQEFYRKTYHLTR